MAAVCVGCLLDLPGSRCLPPIPTARGRPRLLLRFVFPADPAVELWKPAAGFHFILERRW
jgi:hypothetical protein